MNLGRGEQKLGRTLRGPYLDGTSKMRDARARCEYCRGWLDTRSARPILVDDETRHVHARHPRRDGEQNPKEK